MSPPTPTMFSVALLLLAAGSCVKSVTLTQPASETVQPGQSLTITCRPSYSVTSYGTCWIRQPAGKGLEWISCMWTGGSTDENNALRNKFSVSRDTSAGTVTLTGQNLQPADTAVYYCAREKTGADYGAFDYWGKGTMVTVTSAASAKPTVYPLMQCGSDSGNTVTLGCLATGFSPSSVTYTWQKNGSTLSESLEYPPTRKGELYSSVSQIRVSRQDWEARNTFKCVATNAAGTGQGEFIMQQVHYQWPKPQVFASQGDDPEITFSCLAKDFSPNKFAFRWHKNEGQPLHESQIVTTPSKEKKTENGTLYSAASFLTVPSTEWRDDTKYTCTFEGKGKNGTVSQQGVVEYRQTSSSSGNECQKADVEITFIDPSMEDLFLKGQGTIVCQVKANKKGLSRIFWIDEKGDDVLGATKETAQTRTGTFTLPLKITFDEWKQGWQPSCAVEHDSFPDGTKETYRRDVGGPTQRPSVFMMPPLEHTRKDTVTLTCYVKDFSPKDVFVSWLVDDEEANSDFEYHTTEPVEHKGTYSAYGHLTVSLEQWKKSDVVFSCAVHHQSLTNTSKAIVRSIGYKTFENINLVNLNMNIPEKCKAL